MFSDRDLLTNSVKKSIGILLLIATPLILFRSQAGGSVDSSYQQTIEAWRKTKEQDLRAPDSWLSLVGLFWLNQGPNSFGAGKGHVVALPDGAGTGGILTLDGNKVYLEPSNSPQISLNGKPVTSRTLLNTDQEKTPDEITAGKIKMNIIDREGRLGIRAWDPEHPDRKSFAGRQWYAPAEAYVVRAKFKPFEKPTELDIKNIVGMKLHAKSPGRLEFEFKGQKYALVVQGEPSEGFFINFKDKTSGKGTYGAGRFLGTDPLTNGEVMIDFNKAVNPPCAFTAFATCPLAPRENTLPVAIDAGEKFAGHH